MKIKLTLFSFILCSQLFWGCSNKSDKFIGTWVENRHQFGNIVGILTITKSDNNFIIHSQNYGDAGNYAAVYDSSNDKLTVSTGGGSSDMIIDGNTKFLVFQGEYFSKQ